jgi:hypothetical protein
MSVEKNLRPFFCDKHGSVTRPRAQYFNSKNPQLEAPRAVAPAAALFGTPSTRTCTARRQLSAHLSLKEAEVRSRCIVIFLTTTTPPLRKLSSHRGSKPPGNTRLPPARLPCANFEPVVAARRWLLLCRGCCSAVVAALLWWLLLCRGCTARPRDRRRFPHRRGAPGKGCGCGGSRRNGTPAAATSPASAATCPAGTASRSARGCCPSARCRGNPTSPGSEEAPDTAAAGHTTRAASSGHGSIR